MHWGCKPPLDEGPTHFPQSTLETGGPGSPSGFCPLWEAPNLTVTLSRTIIADMQRAWDMCSTCPHNPSLQTNTYTAYKSRSYFFSLPRIPLLLCVLLFLAAHSPSLSCLCPFCMCELRSPRARGQPYSFLFFFTCSQIPSLSQAGIVPQLIERESWGKFWWVIINQPAMKTSRYSKHQGSAGRQLRNPLLLVVFGHATVFDCRTPPLKAHALIDYTAATETGPFKSAFL